VTVVTHGGGDHRRAAAYYSLASSPSSASGNARLGGTIFDRITCASHRHLKDLARMIHEVA
jgi:hypothetical protein